MPDSDFFAIKNCTLAELIDAGDAYLAQHDLVYGHGTDNSFDESAWLALEACGISPAEPVRNYNIPVNARQLQRAKEWFRHRATDNIPVAYLTGRSWFAGLEFLVDKRALIPRSPIAELIGKRFTPWLSTSPNAALDLCCGGGCIGIAVAIEFPECSVDALDLSADALALATDNVAKHMLQQRVTLHQGDLFEPIEALHQYDLIVSNPPYVDAKDMHTLDKEFAHEPQMGLAAGPDGLDIVARMLKLAKNYLSEEGVLIVEVGNSQRAVEKRFAKLDLQWLDFEYGGDGVFLVRSSSL